MFRLVIPWVLLYFLSLYVVGMGYSLFLTIFNEGAYLLFKSIFHKALDLV